MSPSNNKYPVPSRVTHPDGSRRYAFATFVMRNDTYVPGALVLASRLKRSGTQADLLCMVTEAVSPQARRAMKVLYDHVIPIGEVAVPHARRQERQDRPYLFTRFNALRLGKDGDLGFQYDKVVVLDADVLPLRHYDHLFTLGTPAGIINERKTHCLEWSGEGRFIIPPDSLRTGKWIWHRHYEDLCPHGQPTPRDLTDRVVDDPSNMGVNACLWVLRPSFHEYGAIMRDVGRPEVRERINAWNWPEMQYATHRWSGQWKNVDLRFCSFNGYPAPSAVFGIHYSGLKPWSMNREDSLRRFARYEDFQYWFREFRLMTEAHPELLACDRLRRLGALIEGLAA